MFYELAVLGPILTKSMGLGQQCLACCRGRAADETVCAGFGPGCIGYRRSVTDRSAADSRFEASDTAISRKD